MRVSYVLCLTLLAGLQVLCLPLAGSSKAVQPTSEPPTTSSRPKRDEPQSQCCGQTKRESSCCGLSDPKDCCGADGSKACCGAESQTEPTKVKRQGDDTNKTCCGKDRIAREPHTFNNPETNKTVDTSTKPSSVNPIHARFSRQTNSSCCGLSGPQPIANHEKRQARDCCGQTVELAPSPTKDQVKVRVLRGLCCGLEGEEAKKCCGASQNPTIPPPSKSKRCDHSTTPQPGKI